MTRQRQIKLATVTFIVILILLTSFFVWRSNQNYQNQSRAITPQLLINPIVNPISKMETSSQISPDGTHNLKMIKTQNADKTSTFIFKVTGGTGAIEQEIYSIRSADNFSIPFNTWSPDNKYLFIQKNDNGALVFKASGEPIMSGQLYFDVGDLFIDKVKNVFPRLVTGWASPTLLIVNTVKEDNSKGPSYWFEVPSKAILRLSSQF